MPVFESSPLFALILVVCDKDATYGQIGLLGNKQHVEGISRFIYIKPNSTFDDGFPVLWLMSWRGLEFVFFLNVSVITASAKNPTLTIGIVVE